MQFNTVHKYLNDFRNSSLTEKINILSIFVLCASIYVTPFMILGIAVYFLIDKKKSILKNRYCLLYPYFFFGLNGFVSSIYSQNFVSIGATVLIFIPYLIYGLYVENEFTPELSIKLLWLLVYLSLPVGLFSFFQKAFVHLIQGRVMSTFFNANLYAFFLMFVLIIAFGLFLENPSKKKKMLLVFISIVNVIALLLTGCRTAYIALAISVLFYLLLSKRYQLALVLLGLCAVFLYSVTINPHLIPRYKVLDDNIAQREKLWLIAWDAIKTNPFMGRGLLSYKYYALQFNIYKPHAHNLLLNTWVEMGITGVFISLWIFYIILKQGIQGLRSNNKYRNYICIILSCTMAAFIHSIDDNPIENLQTGMLFAMLISMLMVFTRDIKNKGHIRPDNMCEVKK